MSFNIDSGALDLKRERVTRKPIYDTSKLDLLVRNDDRSYMRHRLRRRFGWLLNSTTPPCILGEILHRLGQG
ncbi:hypothetical protein KCV03_g23, partial [Aureobasidium melanogenum]